MPALERILCGPPIVTQQPSEAAVCHNPIAAYAALR